MIIPKGTTVYYSTVGAKGFIYPSEKSFVSFKQVEAKPLNFSGSTKKQAYLVDGSILEHSDKRKLVVWLDK